MGKKKKSQVQRSPPEPAASVSTVENRNAIRSGSAWPAVYGGLTVLFTAMMVLTSYLQWKAIRETAQDSQRAWVSVHSLTATLEVGKPLTIVAEFTNTGSTPAVSVSGKSVSIPVPGRTVPPFDLTGDLQFSGGLIPPGGMTHASTVITRDGKGFGAPLSPALLRSIIERQVDIYAIGRIDYKDAFGRSHWLQYCSRLNPIDPVGITWEACSDHNGTGSI